ncbi:MAG: phospho-sugar mutase [Candidatus Onthovivens sp.]
MEEKTLKNYHRWLNSNAVDEKDKEILRKMSESEIDDAFFQDIKFGTAGMRGVLGPGTNRLNVHTIKKACVGFGIYLNKHFKENVSCVISHDNRFMSREFTLECAEILNNMGITTYIFDSLRPTPELSFAVRQMKASGGIMITASHNPKEDNGFKVYDEIGCQLVPNKIKDLIEIISSLPDELSVEVPVSENKKENIILPASIDEDYCSLCETVQINPDLDKKGFKIVYTPNHGASFVNAMKVFKDCGYEIYPVLSQCNPDPAFSGTLSPNPEDPRSYIEPIKLAKSIDADLICMTDPDGDRVGLACKNRKGEYVLLTGNESAALLLDYIIKERKAKGTLPASSIVYNTVVSSSLGKKICDYYGVKIESLLTGFKFIGDRIHYYEQNGGPTFIFGYEESYGCLVKPFVRDKDGIQAILLYCELALYYQKHGLTLDEAYEKLGERFGQHKAKLFNIYFKGSEGKKEMDSLMHEIQNNPFTSLLDKKVSIIENYSVLSRYNLIDKSTSAIENLPSCNLMKFIFEDGSNISIRPSGTEPKCKFYVEVVDKSLENAGKKCDILYKELLRILRIN